MSAGGREDLGKGTALQLQRGHSKRSPALSTSPSARARSGRLKIKKTWIFPSGEEGGVSGPPANNLEEDTCRGLLTGRKGSWDWETEDSEQGMQNKPLMRGQIEDTDMPGI